MVLQVGLVLKLLGIPLHLLGQAELGPLSADRGLVEHGQGPRGAVGGVGRGDQLPCGGVDRGEVVAIGRRERLQSGWREGDPVVGGRSGHVIDRLRHDRLVPGHGGSAHRRVRLRRGLAHRLELFPDGERVTAPIQHDLKAMAAKVDLLERAEPDPAEGDRAERQHEEQSDELRFNRGAGRRHPPR